MTHYATPEFWKCYRLLPADIRELADAKFALLKADARHPSLQFKKVGKVWSARVTLDFRALATEAEGDFTWFWLGPHDEYLRLIRS